MADIASRIFGHNRVPDTSFLSLLSSTLPLTHQQSCQNVRFTPGQILLVILPLRRARLPLQRWMTSYRPKIGTTGWNSSWTHKDTLTYKTAPQQSNLTSSYVFLNVTGGDTMVKVVKSSFKHQKPPSVMWHQPLYWQAAQTPVDPTV